MIHDEMVDDEMMVSYEMVVDSEMMDEMINFLS